MKKRILHVSKYYYPFRGGTEVVCQDIAEGLMGEYENKIICFNHEKGDKTDWVNGIEVIRCGCFCKVASQSLSFSYYSNLKRVIREWKPDAIHFHHPNPFVTALLLNLVPRDVKLVVHWHLDIFKTAIFICLFEVAGTKTVGTRGCRHCNKYKISGWVIATKAFSRQSVSY